MHNNFSGLFFGIPFTKPNPDFLQSVKTQLQPESKLLVVCQEGLRLVYDIQALNFAFFEHVPFFYNYVIGAKYIPTLSMIIFTGELGWPPLVESHLPTTFFIFTKLQSETLLKNPPLDLRVSPTNNLLIILYY